MYITERILPLRIARLQSMAMHLLSQGDQVTARIVRRRIDHIIRYSNVYR